MTIEQILQQQDQFLARHSLTELSGQLPTRFQEAFAGKVSTSIDAIANIRDAVQSQLEVSSKLSTVIDAIESLEDDDTVITTRGINDIFDNIGQERAPSGITFNRIYFGAATSEGQFSLCSWFRYFPVLIAGVNQLVPKVDFIFARESDIGDLPISSMTADEAAASILSFKRLSVTPDDSSADVLKYDVSVIYNGDWSEETMEALEASIADTIVSADDLTKLTQVLNGDFDFQFEHINRFLSQSQSSFNGYLNQVINYKEKVDANDVRALIASYFGSSMNQSASPVYSRESVKYETNLFGSMVSVGVNVIGSVLQTLITIANPAIGIALGGLVSGLSYFLDSTVGQTGYKVEHLAPIPTYPGYSTPTSTIYASDLSRAGYCESSTVYQAILRALSTTGYVIAYDNDAAWEIRIDGEMPVMNDDPSAIENFAIAISKIPLAVPLTVEQATNLGEIKSFEFQNVYAGEQAGYVIAISRLTPSSYDYAGEDGSENWTDTYDYTAYTTMTEEQHILATLFSIARAFDCRQETYAWMLKYAPPVLSVDVPDEEADYTAKAKFYFNAAKFYCNMAAGDINLSNEYWSHKEDGQSAAEVVSADRVPQEIRWAFAQLFLNTAVKYMALSGDQASAFGVTKENVMKIVIQWDQFVRSAYASNNLLESLKPRLLHNAIPLTSAIRPAVTYPEVSVRSLINTAIITVGVTAAAVTTSFFVRRAFQARTLSKLAMREANLSKAKKSLLENKSPENVKAYAKAQRQYNRTARRARICGIVPGVVVPTPAPNPGSSNDPAATLPTWVSEIYNGYVEGQSLEDISSTAFGTEVKTDLANIQEIVAGGTPEGPVSLSSLYSQGESIIQLIEQDVIGSNP